MNKELIIESSPEETIVALLEDRLLVEVHREKSGIGHTVGDVYLGRVKKIMPGLNAAFIDVGSDKDAFLHYLDLGANVKTLNKYVDHALAGELHSLNMKNFKFEEEIPKTDTIANVLKQNQQILVQIIKEPISTKGPRLTSEISFAGRYMVLIPFSDKISVSQKIKSVEERNRLKRLVSSIRPEGFGIIIRTVAEGKNVAQLDADLKSLTRKWNQTKNLLNKAKAPKKIISEMDKTTSLLRDLLNNDFNQIVVNTQEAYEDAKSYVETIAPEKADIVKLHKAGNPIFDHYGITKQIKSSFGRIVPLKHYGAYMVIEHTEALHVVDINSGHRLNAENTQEDNALEVNMEAAVEVARQLRLRDIGGIIVVDFIDLRMGAHRKQLYEKMKEEMARDSAKHQVLPASKFGLIQITRQRVRPQVKINVLEKCPVCKGTGEVTSSFILLDEIEALLQHLVHDQNQKELTLLVNPYLYAYLTKGFFTNYKWRWRQKYGVKINFKSVKSYHYLEYHFLDKNGEIIKL